VLGQTLHLEASELNRMEDARLPGFRVTTSLLLRALASEMLRGGGLLADELQFVFRADLTSATD